MKIFRRWFARMCRQAWEDAREEADVPKAIASTKSGRLVSSLEEIRSSFKLRYPDRSAAVVAGDQNAVSTLQQQLKELRETGHCI